MFPRHVIAVYLPGWHPGRDPLLGQVFEAGGTRRSGMDTYEVEEKKLAAAHVLMHYSPFVMTCIGEGVQPSELRLHLLKEVSCMPTILKSKPTAAEKVNQEASSSSVEVSDCANVSNINEASRLKQAEDDQ